MYISITGHIIVLAFVDFRCFSSSFQLLIFCHHIRSHVNRMWRR